MEDELVFMVYDSDDNEIEMCFTYDEAVFQVSKMYRKAFEDNTNLNVETLKDIKVYQVFAITEIVNGRPYLRRVKEDKWSIL